MKYKLTTLFAAAAFATSTAYAGSDSTTLNEDNWSFDYWESDTPVQMSPNTNPIAVGGADNMMFEQEVMLDDVETGNLIDGIDDTFELYR